MLGDQNTHKVEIQMDGISPLIATIGKVQFTSGLNLALYLEQMLRLLLNLSHNVKIVEVHGVIKFGRGDGTAVPTAHDFIGAVEINC